MAVADDVDIFIAKYPILVGLILMAPNRILVVSEKLRYPLGFFLFLRELGVYRSPWSHTGPLSDSDIFILLLNVIRDFSLGSGLRLRLKPRFKFRWSPQMAPSREPVGIVVVEFCLGSRTRNSRGSFRDSGGEVVGVFLQIQTVQGHLGYLVRS